MQMSLKKAIQDAYDVDLTALTDKYSDIILAGLAEDHEKEIGACAASIGAGALASSNDIFWVSAELLFAIGYKAGYKASRDAPDLSAFDDALRDVEL